MHRKRTHSTLSSEKLWSTINRCTVPLERLTASNLVTCSANFLYLLLPPGGTATLSKLNERLLSIHPPHIFIRLPRRLEDRSDWKASEWRHWLLFYRLPCTVGLLPAPYRKHLRKLSEACAILLSTNLDHSLLSYAGKKVHVKIDVLCPVLSCFLLYLPVLHRNNCFKCRNKH